MASKILILAETGFIIRNLLLGKFPGELSGDISIIAAVPDPEDPMLSDLKLNNIEYIAFPREKEASVAGFTPFKRLFNLPHIMYRMVEGVNNNSSMKIQSKVLDTLNSNWYRTGVFLINLAGKILLGIGLRSFIESLFFRQVKKSEFYKDWLEILKKNSPDLLLSTMLSHAGLYRYSADLPPVLAAQQLGIEVGSLVQSWDNVSTKPFIFPNCLVRWWTWSEFMNKEMLEYHKNVNPASMRIIGGLQFDYHLDLEFLPREVFLKSLKVNPAKRYILFTPGTRKLLPHEDLTFVELIKRMIKQKLDLQYVIRLHPKDFGARWEEHKDFFSENNVVVQYTNLDVSMDRGGLVSPREFYTNQINIMHHAAVLVNTGSTTTVDAAVLDLPIVNINFDEKDEGMFPQPLSTAYLFSTHLSPVTHSGGVLLAGDYDEAIAHILSYLDNPSQLKKGREKIVRIITDKVDGKAGARLAREVESLVLPE